MTKVKQVRGREGKIVNIEEHFKDLLEYFNNNRDKASKLCTESPDLKAFLDSLGIFLLLERPETGPRLGIKDGNSELLNSFVDFNSKGYHGVSDMESIHSTPDTEDFSFHFGAIGDLLLKTIVDFFYEKFIRNPEIYLEFVRKKILEELKWNIGAEVYERAFHFMVADYAIPSDFTLFSRARVLVVIGNQADLDTDLEEALKVIDPDEAFIVSLDGNASQMKKCINGLNLERLKCKERINAWTKTNLKLTFFIAFRELSDVIGKTLRIRTADVYLVGDLLSSTEGSEEELVNELRSVEVSKGQPFEDTVKKVLEFCLKDEFESFRCDKQISNHLGTNRKDLLIHNNDPKAAFWRTRLSNDKVEIILFDAKNYGKKLKPADLAPVKAYLVDNKFFGDFAIVLSRKGFARDDYLSQQAGQSNSQVILVLDEDDLVEMIRMKSSFQSPTDLIVKKYNEIVRRV